MKPGQDISERVADYSRRAGQLRELFSGRRRLRRGAAYASAAGAALAGASAAEAAIVYSGLQNVMISINGTGTSSFAGANLFAATPLPLSAGLFVYRYVSFGSTYQYAGLFASGSLYFAGVNYTAINFPLGASITGPFSQSTGDLARAPVGTLNFMDGVPGFMGFETSPGGNKGWIQVQWDDLTGDNLPDKLTAIDWAINNMLGPIKAGQTAIPEPGAAALIGLVASGAAGVMALKKLWKKAA